MGKEEASVDHAPFISFPEKSSDNGGIEWIMTIHVSHMGLGRFYYYVGQIKDRYEHSRKSISSLVVVHP